MATPRKIDNDCKTLELKKRLEKCWELDLDWALYPAFLKEVSLLR